MLASSSAFASLARLAVMGTEPAFTSAGAAVTVNTVNGSLWYDDDYNVFYNPTYVNNNKNYVVVQKGLEGGFFKGEWDNFAYGVYMNRTGFAGANIQGAGMTANATLVSGLTTANLSTQRPIDIFIAGDTGIKWGLHVAWAYNRDQSAATAANGGFERSARYWHVDFGAEVVGFEPFIGATFMSKIQQSLGQTVSPQGEQDLNDFTGGFRYKYEGWTPYAMYRQYRESGTGAAGVATRQVSTKLIGVGFGHDTKVADGVHVYKRLGVYRAAVKDDAAGSATSDTGKDQTIYVLPINVSLEADATSWLVLRAGATYDFWNETTNAKVNGNNTNNLGSGDKKTSNAGTTTFRVGSTLKFGKLSVDSAFGNGAAAAANTAAANLDTSAIGFDSQLFGLVSASYRW